MLPTEYLLIEERGKLKLLPRDKYYINKNTPVGDAAEFYEIKPYGGRKMINEVVGFLEIDKDGDYELTDKYGRKLTK